MIKQGGGSGGITGVLSGGGANTGATDANSVFAASVGSSPVAKVAATRITEMSRTIAQGRIIHATLETALNTDLPAPIRAIVSRDTYGEAGTVPLIPKGSRLIGQYNTSLLAGQTRVFVVWTRVIRPDGVDIMIGSPGVDQIGQAGFAGQVDSKFQQTFARAFVASIMNIGLAIGADEITEDPVSSTTSTGTNSTTESTSNAATEATTEALEKLGGVTDTFLQRFMGIQPTILVDQGTPVNVLVNKDLVFPGNIAGVNVVD
jgi:type IV secretion system protein VirB10